MLPLGDSVCSWCTVHQNNHIVISQEGEQTSYSTALVGVTGSKMWAAWPPMAGGCCTAPWVAGWWREIFWVNCSPREDTCSAASSALAVFRWEFKRSKHTTHQLCLSIAACEHTDSDWMNIQQVRISLSTLCLIFYNEASEVDFTHLQPRLILAFSPHSTKQTWSELFHTECYRTSQTRLSPWGRWSTVRSTWRTSQRLTGTWRPTRTWGRLSLMWLHRNRKLSAEQLQQY